MLPHLYNQFTSAKDVMIKIERARKASKEQTKWMIIWLFLALFHAVMMKYASPVFSFFLGYSIVMAFRHKKMARLNEEIIPMLELILSLKKMEELMNAEIQFKE